MRLSVLAAMICLLVPVVASAQNRPDAGTIMAPAIAHTKALAGDLVLVDIRTPDEWRETGVPSSAQAITMHQEPKALLAQLERATGGDKSKPLALICRTGNRTSFLQAELKKHGYTSIINVAEGVVGGPFGQGWLKAGLPVRKP
jgi:rhodanese-related sulfurtransferase